MRLGRVGMLAAAVGGLTLGAATVKATEVKYTTDGVFSSPSAPVGLTTFSVINSGHTFEMLYNGVVKLDVDFTGDSTTQDVFTPITGQLGFFHEVWTGGGSISGLPVNTTLANFTLTINQTVPTSGSGASGGAVDSISGTIQTNSGGLTIYFNPTSIQISPVHYALNNLNNHLLSLNDADTGQAPFQGYTSVTATITADAVPVPAAAWMGFSTLIGLGILGVVRRRRSA